MLLASWTFDTVVKGIRSFIAENLGSVGQRAAKLLAIKLWELFDFARIRDHLRSNHSQSLMAGNFAALWPTDPKFLALKDLSPFKFVSKF